MTDAATPTPSAPPAPGAGLSSPLAVRAKLHIRRAALCDFTRMSATEEERTALRAAPLPVTTKEGQDYLAWRLSMAWVGLGTGLIAALIALIEWIAANKEGQPGGVSFMLFVMQVGAKVAMVCALWGVIRRWRDAAASRKLLRWAWSLGFFVPLLAGLVPLAEMWPTPNTEEQILGRGVAKLVFGLYYLILLAPSFLSVFPGGARAGMAMKTLLHGSGVGSAVTALFAPLYSFQFVLAFVVVQQLAGSFLVVFGMGLVAIGPLALMKHAMAMVAPLSSADAGRAVARARNQSRWFLAAGGLLILIAAFDIRLIQWKLIGDILSVATLFQIAFWYVATLTTCTAAASDAIVQCTTTNLARRPWWMATEEGRRAEDQVAAVSAAFPPPAPPTQPTGGSTTA